MKNIKFSADKKVKVKNRIFSVVKNRE